MEVFPLMIVLVPLAVIAFVWRQVYKANRRVRLCAEDGGAVWDPQAEIERLEVQNNTLRAENFELRKEIELMTPQKLLSNRVDRIEKHLGFDGGPYRATQRPPTMPVKRDLVKEVHDHLIRPVPQPRPGTITK